MANNNSFCSLQLGQNTRSSLRPTKRFPFRPLLSGFLFAYALISTCSYLRASQELPHEDRFGLVAPVLKSESTIPRIAILSVSTPDRTQMYQPATNSKTCYSAKHGWKTWVLYGFFISVWKLIIAFFLFSVRYTFIIDTNDAKSSLNPWWRKVTALQKYLPYYDWILFMDGDTLVTNYTIRLEWFLPSPDENIDLIVTDHNIALNNGVFFLRNSAWSRKSALSNDDMRSNQSCFRFLNFYEVPISISISRRMLFAGYRIFVSEQNT